MIRGLVAASVGIEEIVLACDARGFGNPEYREDIAYALAKTADPGGLSESLCAMLRGWLSHGQVPVAASGNRDWARDERETDSILWGMHGGEALPHGNYPILYCLALGYLLRCPPHDVAWLEVLEQHLERDERQEVWHALTRQLRYIGSADQVRGTRVVDTVFSRYPGIRDSVRGAILVAHTCGWVDQAALGRWLDGMRSSRWPRGAQAYGEIVCLRSTLSHGEWAEEVVDDIVTSPDALSREALGVAHACAHLWDQDGDRERMTELIATMLPSATGPVADALLRAFPHREHIVIDRHLLRLLDVLAAHPQVLAHRPPLFLDTLQRLMTTAPDRVLALCQAMVAGLEAGAASEIHMDGPRLVALALTFQRMDSFRAEGLELFERLLEIGCYGVGKALDELRPRIGG